MESVIKNILGVTIVSKEIECADRIVYETEFIKLFQLVPGPVNVFFYILK